MTFSDDDDPGVPFDCYAWREWRILVDNIYLYMYHVVVRDTLVFPIEQNDVFYRGMCLKDTTDLTYSCDMVKDGIAMPSAFAEELVRHVLGNVRRYMIFWDEEICEGEDRSFSEWYIRCTEDHLLVGPLDEEPVCAIDDDSLVFCQGPCILPSRASYRAVSYSDLPPLQSSARSRASEVGALFNGITRRSNMSDSSMTDLGSEGENSERNQTSSGALSGRPPASCSDTRRVYNQLRFDGAESSTSSRISDLVDYIFDRESLHPAIEVYRWYGWSIFVSKSSYLVVQQTQHPASEPSSPDDGSQDRSPATEEHRVAGALMNDNYSDKDLMVKTDNGLSYDGRTRGIVVGAKSLSLALPLDSNGWYYRRYVSDNGSSGWGDQTFETVWSAGIVQPCDSATARIFDIDNPLTECDTLSDRVESALGVSGRDASEQLTANSPEAPRCPTSIHIDGSFSAFSPGMAPRLQLRRVEALLNQESRKLAQLGETLLFGNWFICVGRNLRILNTIDPYVELQVRRFCCGYFHFHKRDLRGVKFVSEEDTPESAGDSISVSSEASITSTEVSSGVPLKTSLIITLNTFGNRKVWRYGEWIFFSGTVKNAALSQVRARGDKGTEKGESCSDYLVGCNCSRDSRIALPASSGCFYYYRASSKSKFLRLDVRRSVAQPEQQRVAPSVLGFCRAPRMYEEIKLPLNKEEVKTSLQGSYRMEVLGLETEIDSLCVLQYFRWYIVVGDGECRVVPRELKPQSPDLTER